MADSGLRSPIEKEAAQRSYFRSLNSKDIEGANTNTLISKAVKNKMIAQKELERRRKEQEEKKVEEERVRRQIEEYQSRPKVHTTPNQNDNDKTNFHLQQRMQHSNSSIMDEKKRRESELMRLAQQRKNYAVVSLDALNDMAGKNNLGARNNIGDQAGPVSQEHKPVDQY